MEVEEMRIRRLTALLNEWDEDNLGQQLEVGSS